MEKSACDGSPTMDDSSLLIGQILQMENVIQELEVKEECFQSLFLYSLLRHSADLFKTIWTNENYKTLLRFTRKPSLFLHIESEFTTSEWTNCVNLILRSPIALQLIQRINNDYIEHNENGFFFELLWAFWVKKVDTKGRSEIIKTCLNLGIKVAAVDVNYCIELFGCNAELDTFICNTSQTFANEHMCEFPIPAFMFGWEAEISTETVFRLFKNLIGYDQYVTLRSKRRYIMLSLKFFSMSAHKKRQLEELCKVHVDKHDEILDTLDLVPVFTSLCEISRNCLYKCMQQSANVERNANFLEKLKKLELPQTVVDILRFKRPVY